MRRPLFSQNLEQLLTQKNNTLKAGMPELLISAFQKALSSSYLYKGTDDKLQENVEKVTGKIM